MGGGGQAGVRSRRDCARRSSRGATWTWCTPPPRGTSPPRPTAWPRLSSPRPNLLAQPASRPPPAGHCGVRSWRWLALWAARGTGPPCIRQGSHTWSKDEQAVRGRSELPPSLPPSLVSLSLCLYLSLSDSLRREIVRRSRYLCRAEAQWIKKVACYQATREAACNEVTPLAQQTEQRSHHPTHGSESRIKCSNLLINCCRFNG